MIIVSDSSPLISLARANYIFVLPKLFGAVIVPEAVMLEIQSAPEGAPEIDLRTQPWLKSLAVKDRQKLYSLEATLDRGEAEAIVLALELKADRLLVDERKARAKAQFLGVRVIGVLGILLQAKREGLIPKIAPALAALDSAGIWIADELRNEALRSAGE